LKNLLYIGCLEIKQAIAMGYGLMSSGKKKDAIKIPMFFLKKPQYFQRIDVIFLK
jgi:hypothetical protein